MTRTSRIRLMLISSMGACMLATEVPAQFSTSTSELPFSSDAILSAARQQSAIESVLRTSIFAPSYSQVRTLSSVIASRVDKIPPKKDPKVVRNYVRHEYPDASPAQQAQIANLLIEVDDALYRTYGTFQAAPKGPLLFAQAMLRKDVIDRQFKFEVAAVQVKGGPPLQRAIDSFGRDLGELMIRGPQP